jgi:hypothetical protein
MLRPSGKPTFLPPRDKLARHDYDSNQLGITEEALQGHFTAYHQQFTRCCTEVRESGW